MSGFLSADYEKDLNVIDDDNKSICFKNELDSEEELIKQVVISLIVSKMGVTGKKKVSSDIFLNIVSYAKAIYQQLFNFDDPFINAILKLSIFTNLSLLLFSEFSLVLNNLLVFSGVILSGAIILSIYSIYFLSFIDGGVLKNFKENVKLYKGHTLMKSLGVNWIKPIKSQDSNIKDLIYYTSIATKGLRDKDTGSLKLYYSEISNDLKDPYWTDRKIRSVILQEFEQDIAALINSFRPGNLNHELLKDEWDIDNCATKKEDKEKESDLKRKRISKLSELLLNMKD